MTADAFSEEFWAQAWQDTAESSILQSTQKTIPSRWLTFYDNVSTIWLEMMGDGWILNEKISRILIQHELISPGKTALDIGCGPGALAISLAKRGILVTALDTSRKMLDCLISESRRRNLQGITPILADWSQFSSRSLHDLVLAAFFPQVMSPSGIQRMERLSKGICVMVTGCGKDPFPIRARLWHDLMDDALPQSGRHLSCALNYLLTSGRSPNLMHLSWPFHVNLSMDTIGNYFRSYFAIFGRDHQSVNDAIQIEMAEYVQNGTYQSTGEMQIALIWWHPKERGMQADKHLNPSRLSCQPC